MQFNSLLYILFFVFVFSVYYLIPHKFRIAFLVIASYGFYAAAEPVLLVYLIAVTVFTYASGRIIEAGSRKKPLIVASIVIEVTVLAVIKYSNFAIDTINFTIGRFSDLLRLDHLNILVPLGISFITFQTISYLVDVFRGRISSEKNFLNYALFVSFFPVVTQGPILKPDDIIPQFKEQKNFDIIRVKESSVTLLFGLLMKMVIADRIAIPVNNVFSHLSGNSGMNIIFAFVLFAVQIYADFAGYSLIAISSANLLGFDIKRNFRQPYLSTSVGEFWRRWHMSLNVWLKDYLYIPLGGSRCSKCRKYFNIMVTFTVSGLWHGADIGYIIWGALNGVYVVIENMMNSSSKRKKNTGEHKSYTALKRVCVFLLILSTWVFFRARSLDTILKCAKAIVFNLGLTTFFADIAKCICHPVSESFLGVSAANYIVTAVYLLILIFADVKTSRGVNLPERFVGLKKPWRWVILYFLIFSIIIFGVYGYGYDSSSFIYAQF